MWYWIEANNNRRLRVPLVCSRCKHWNWWLFSPLEPSPQRAANGPVHNQAADNISGHSQAAKNNEPPPTTIN